MMDSLTACYILSLSVVLYTVDAYPRGYPGGVRIHPNTKGNPLSKVSDYFHSELDQFIPKGSDVKEYNNKNVIQLAQKSILNQFNVKFNSERILQDETWSPKYAGSKTNSEEMSMHILKKRSVRNVVTPSSNDHHITNVFINGHLASSLGSENQDQTNAEHHNQLEGDVERNDRLKTDLPSPTQIPITAYRRNQHSADSELNNHQPTESTFHIRPTMHLHINNNHETHLHQQYSYSQNDGEEVTDLNNYHINNENTGPTVISDNDQHEPYFQNGQERSMNQEHDDINNMHSNPNVNIDLDLERRNLHDGNQHYDDSTNGNEEGTGHENDNTEDLNPTSDTNSDINRNEHSGEIPYNENTPFQPRFDQQETTTESSPPDEHNIPFYDEDHGEADVSPTHGDENRHQGEISGLEDSSPNVGPNGRPENNNLNEENTATRTTRNVGHAHDETSSHANGQENPVVNGPGNDGIPSTDTGNGIIHNNNNGNPAHVESGDDGSSSPILRGNNTSQIIDHEVPFVNHPADSSKANQTSGNINSTVSTFATVKADMNQTTEINATTRVLRNQTTSIPVHSSQQPSEISTPTPDVTTSVLSLHSPVATHQPASISSSTTSTSTTASYYTTTSPGASSHSSTSNMNEDLNTPGSVPLTIINDSLVGGSLSLGFTGLTTKLDEASTSTTEGEPKEESTTTMSIASSTVKDRPTQKPQCFMELHLSMSWSDFCSQEMSIRSELVELLQQEGSREEITVDQVRVLNAKEEECSAVTIAPNEQIQVQVYLVNTTHHFDRNLTLVCAQKLRSPKFQAGDTSLIQEKLLAVHLCDEFQTSPGTNQNSNSEADDSNDSLLNDPGVTIALVIAIVGSCCGVGLITLQTIVRRRHRNGLRMNNNNSVHNVVSNNNRSFSITSADSIQLYTVSKSAGGVINLGLNLMEPADPTHPLNLTQLSEFCADDHKIYHEYQKLPNRLPRLSVVPTGDEDKNRYANILPLVHTRVKLNKDDSRNSQSSYINANYVTGPNNECQYYIATQAPTTKTINDFWTMVWQQEAKAIVMLTQLEEAGQCKAATYWPELSGKSAAQRHGDFLIELKQKDVNQEYISSRLEVNNLRKIETRQIQHFWYTCWPAQGTPEPISLVKFVLDTRPRYENTGKPLIVHCSPGTGRTGTFIGLDLCMRQFESKRIVDVMKTIHDLRLERAGAVQNKEQYALLYNATNEYASIVASPVASVSSSASTLHALLPD